MYVRVQSWFPFTIQVYVNGHNWLARQMQQRRFGFVHQHNAFTQLDDPAAAQGLADRVAKLPRGENPQALGTPGQPRAGRLSARSCR